MLHIFANKEDLFNPPTLKLQFQFSWWNGTNMQENMIQRRQKQNFTLQLLNNNDKNLTK